MVHNHVSFAFSVNVSGSPRTPQHSRCKLAVAHSQGSLSQPTTALGSNLRTRRGIPGCLSAVGPNHNTDTVHNNHPPPKKQKSAVHTSVGGAVRHERLVARRRDHRSTRVLPADVGNELPARVNNRRLSGFAQAARALRAAYWKCLRLLLLWLATSLHQFWVLAWYLSRSPFWSRSIYHHVQCNDRICSDGLELFLTLWNEVSDQEKDR